MSAEITAVPEGSGKHPIVMVVLSAVDIPKSADFYAKLFGWQMHAMSPHLTAALIPSGPSVTLRSDVPAGFQSAVPFLGVADVEALLKRVVAAGGAIEREPWSIPMVGTLARFKTPSGTIYGLTTAVTPGDLARVPMPFGSNPKPAPNTVCSLEMYGADGDARFLTDLFGWGTLPTMPQFVAFDPGKGIGGVLQSHTPTMPAVAYVYVSDVSAKLTEIERAGGKRMGEPMAVPGMACFGYFSDPSGTAMGLIGP